MISFGHFFVKSGKTMITMTLERCAICVKNKLWCETIKHVKMYKKREWERNAML